MHNVNRKKILSMLVVVVLVGGGCAGSSTLGSNKIETPSGDKIEVEVAKTLNEQAKGLSGREEVGEGMVFCFDKAEQREFWMLGMMVPIDMIWIYEGEVMSISDNVPLQENNAITRRNSVKQVDAVLEVGAGMAAELGIEEGSVLEDVVRICN